MLQLATKRHRHSLKKEGQHNPHFGMKQQASNLYAPRSPSPRVSDTGFRVRVCLGFRVQGTGLRLRVCLGLGFRVQGTQPRTASLFSTQALSCLALGRARTLRSFREKTQPWAAKS